MTGMGLKRLTVAGCMAWCVVSADTAWAWLYLRDGGVTGSGFEWARSLALDPAGDVIASGRLGNNQQVVKLQRSFGTEIWTKALSDQGGEASHVAVDAAGNVLVAGWAADPSTTGSSSGSTDHLLTVVKLNGSTGDVLWHTEITAGGDATFSGNAPPADILVDVAGNPVVAVNRRKLPIGPSDLAVIKLSGASGVELWRYRER